MMLLPKVYIVYEWRWCLVNIVNACNTNYEFFGFIIAELKEDTTYYVNDDGDGEEQDQFLYGNDEQGNWWVLGIRSDM